MSTERRSLASLGAIIQHSQRGAYWHTTGSLDFQWDVAVLRPTRRTRVRRLSGANKLKALERKSSLGDLGSDVRLTKKASLDFDATMHDEHGHDMGTT